MSGPRDTGDVAHVDESLRLGSDDGDASNALGGGTDQDDIDDAVAHPGTPVEGDLG